MGRVLLSGGAAGKGKSFEISIEGEDKGSFLCVVKRGSKKAFSVFLEEEGAKGLASWMKNLNSKMVVKGISAKCEEKFRTASVDGKENSFDRFLRVVGDSAREGLFLDLIPEGEDQMGWRAFSEALMELLKPEYQGVAVQGKPIINTANMHLSFSNVVIGTSFHGVRKISRRSEGWVITSDVKDIQARRLLLQKCLVVYVTGENLSLTDLQKEVLRLWHVKVAEFRRRYEAL